MRAQVVDLVARRAQPVHGRAQFRLRLAELVGQLGLALLQVGDRLIAGLLGLVQLLRETFELA